MMLGSLQKEMKCVTSSINVSPNPQNRPLRLILVHQRTQYLFDILNCASRIGSDIVSSSLFRGSPFPFQSIKARHPVSMSL